MPSTAQYHEIEAWLGGNWREAQTAELVHRIQQSGSADESDWITIIEAFDAERFLAQSGDWDGSADSALMITDADGEQVALAVGLFDEDSFAWQRKADAQLIEGWSEWRRVSDWHGDGSCYVEHRPVGV